MLRVAMLSFWHVHARDYAKQATANPSTEIVAAWDEEPERGRAQAAELGVRFYENLDELLAQTTIDAVIIDTPTNLHCDVMLAAARAGKHIFTEKVIAPTLHEVNNILAAVEQAGVKLTVSLPWLNFGYTLAIRDMLERRLLGELTLVRTRLAHNGALGNAWLPEHFFDLEQTGGGALIDLGCHPMYLARLFLGLPESVSASYGYVTGRPIEDNAVATLRYPNGALGVVEAGFVNPFSPFTIEIHGTLGSLFYGTPQNTLLLRSSLCESGEQWITQALPEDAPPAFAQWVEHIQNDTTAHENIALAVDLTRLMEAANLSVQNNQAVRLDTLAH